MFTKRGSTIGAALLGACMLIVHPASGAYDSAGWKEFPVASGAAPHTIVAGPDGNLWFTEYGTSKVGRITPAGVLTEFSTTTPNALPFGIAAGADGNLWVAEGNAFVNKIARVTPEGTFTEFTIPTAQSFPSQLAAGPDGNMWFTEYDGNKIGKITPEGAITEYPVTTPSAGPWDIALGSDGNLWFTESDALKIGRITPAGTVTEFPLDPGGWIGGITSGPGGHLWYTRSTGAIGRITTGGVVTEFPFDEELGEPRYITEGPDGALWFTTETGSDQSYKTYIVRFTPADGFLPVTAPVSGSNVFGITAGPDGNLWATEYDYDHVARINPDLFQPDLVARLLPSGEDVGEDLFANDGDLQSLDAPTTGGVRKAAVRLTAGNDGLRNDALVLRGCGDKRGFRISYRYGDADVTAKVISPSGLRLANMVPGALRSIKISINAKAPADGARWVCTVTLSSQNLAEAVDSMKIMSRFEA